MSTATATPPAEATPAPTRIDFAAIGAALDASAFVKAPRVVKLDPTVEKLSLEIKGGKALVLPMPSAELAAKFKLELKRAAKQQGYVVQIVMGRVGEQLAAQCSVYVPPTPAA